LLLGDQYRARYEHEAGACYRPEARQLPQREAGPEEQGKTNEEHHPEREHRAPRVVHVETEAGDDAAGERGQRVVVA
jgi:hypothetical protein